MMKKALVLFVLVLSSVCLNAQKVRGLDKSPLDVVLLKESRELPSAMKIYYSRPQKNGRVLFGNLVPYDKIWRLGANEATEVVVSKDVIFGGKKLSKGVYTMYAIPTEKEWTIVINKKTDTWGVYAYDKSLDVLRVKVPVQKHTKEIEAFSMKFTKVNANKKASLFMLWGTTKVKVTIEL